jgi:hypothetical protein
MAITITVVADQLEQAVESGRAVANECALGGPIAKTRTILC